MKILIYKSNTFNLFWENFFSLWDKIFDINKFKINQNIYFLY